MTHMFERLVLLSVLGACGSPAPLARPASPGATAATTAVAAPADQDRDGVADPLDRCPAEPEDPDGFADDDGCPEPDNDDDRVPDVDDACPNEPSRRSLGAMDHRGCPMDLVVHTDGPPGDLDDDGYPDASDRCPEHAETFPSRIDGDCVDDGDGCPDGQSVLLIDCRVAISTQVYFSTSRADVTPAIRPLVEAVAATLRAHPTMRVAVRGHSDDRERRALGQIRAEQVAAALTALGVAAEQLVLENAGSTDPATSPKGLRGRELDEARDQNRRVEFQVREPPRLPGRTRP